jgi:molecular chaperone HtpG
MFDRRSVAKAVRFKPDSIPALVVLTAAAKQQERMKQATENITLPEEVRNLLKDVMQNERSVPVTLYLNVDNDTIQKLGKMPPSEDKNNVCVAIYNNALMLAQQVLTPRNAEVMFAGFNRTIDLTISQADELKKLNSKVSALKLELDDKDEQLRLQSVDASLLENIGQLRPDFARSIAAQYKAVGEFCQASSETIARQTGAGKGSIGDAQEQIARHFGLGG